MTQIRRIGVLSAAKILGVLYAAIGLIGGAIFSCISIIGAASAFSDELGSDAFGALFGLGAIIIFPIMYGIMGFIGGAIMAFLYNLIAGAIGGIELELS